MALDTERQVDCDYVVVGSGAGGGTVAARLAEGGMRVVLLEAGGDPRSLQGGDPNQPEGQTLPDDYDVPCFHALASENEAIKWDFFVRHYGDDARQLRDTKYLREWDGNVVDGVLYPRAGTLGGCTAHNAQILVYPHNADWDDIAAATGDASWRADAMRKLFEQLENCHHRPFHRLLSKLGINPSRHGWKGWLQSEKVLPEAVLRDHKLVAAILTQIREAIGEMPSFFDRLRWLVEGKLDPNDWRLVKENAIGIRYPPLTTRGHQRMGTRERVLAVAGRHPDLLRVELDCLATRVLFDDNRRAIGVEYMKGERLYRASGSPNGGGGELRQIHAGREVILAGGAFNTPQLLMLSGIGPRATLERFGVPVRVDLPGVGQNLQDRYEVGVVTRMKEDWKVLEGARFAAGDPQYQEWATKRDGVYKTNGAVLAVIKRSAPARRLPDLFCFALLGPFKGYFPNYSALFAKNLNYLTWAIVKAHTNNRSGEVTLRSADPRDTPKINFRYFDEGSPGWKEDLDSVVAGIRFVRTLTQGLKDKGLVAEETVPGAAVESDDELRAFVRDNAWGHHASCSCPIGNREDGGVLSSDFRVHGTQGLRVVDASIFPRIPGFFIVSSVYVAAEKAAGVILGDAKLR